MKVELGGSSRSEDAVVVGDDPNEATHLGDDDGMTNKGSSGGQYSPRSGVGCCGVIVLAIFVLSTAASLWYKNGVHDSYWSDTEILEIQNSCDAILPPPSQPYIPHRRVLYLTIDGIP
ncbi:hypothetical protein Pelo_19412 [Pelomyxa schiedti]|nr:hypothetical protein Pelo_19412 [Pelomyxa schiedti]